MDKACFEHFYESISEALIEDDVGEDEDDVGEDEDDVGEDEVFLIDLFFDFEKAIA